MKIKLILLFIFNLVTLYAQESCDKVYDGCIKPCGPISERDNRTIIDESFNDKAPYNYVIHQTFDRYTGFFSSTSSFIAPHILITAHHNVVRKSLIKGITFFNPINHKESIYFKKSEFKIYTYKKKLNTQTDIAIIVFKDPKKIAPYYNGCFVLKDILACKSENSEAHLTGFPCDVPDTKIDKKDKLVNLQTSADMPIIGYNFFTCTGDSGAPLWTIENNQPTVIGIHHGGNEGYLNNCYNIAAKIDAAVINWINTYITSK
jgi:V8-like Glu-specific endopeptidase